MRPRTSKSMLQLGEDSFPRLLSTTFVKASETTIRRSPTSAGSLNSSSSFLPVSAPRIFVDHEAGAENMEGANLMVDDGKMKR
jgi:hypothetical protein